MSYECFKIFLNLIKPFITRQNTRIIRDTIAPFFESTNVYADVFIFRYNLIIRVADCRKIPDRTTDFSSVNRRKASPTHTQLTTSTDKLQVKQPIGGLKVW